MTILARTVEHLVEFEAGYLTIARYSDGHCKGVSAKGVAGGFRDSLKWARDNGRTVESVIDTYLNKLLRKFEWEPLYQPERMPGANPERDAQTGAAEDLAKVPAWAVGTLEPAPVALAA